MASPSRLIGSVLGHYRIVEQIGAGGMGVVFRAHDQQLERDVAIKILPASSFEDPAARARLLREARTASKLNHPHICTVYEVGEADGQAFIAMELVAGPSLSTRLAAGALPAEQVLAYGVQLADALAHAHERGVVHRDFKSANVVIPDNGRAKVLDFGLAKHFPESQLEEATRSQASLEAGVVAGTLAYMPPEQLRGQPADTRNDVWALGVVLYEMTTGCLPFRGDTGFELSSAILNQPLPALPAKVPLELRAVIERCLEKNPAQRYQRAGEVLAALEAIQKGRVPSLPVSLRYFLRRHRRLAPAALVGLVLVMVALLPGVRRRLAPSLGGEQAIRSLAVLPLENLSGDPEQAYFADGVHESLITDLSKLRGLRRVIARSSVRRYHKTDKAISLIATELGVDAVVTGAVTRVGDRVQVTVRLVRADTEENLWAERYERQVRDVLTVQNEIVSAITRHIRLQLTPDEQARLARRPSVDPEAYETYLKGKFQLNKFTPEGFRSGLTLLHQAVDKDPSNAAAYAALAMGYSLVGHDAFPDAFLRSQAAARRALELDDTLAEVHEALAENKLYREWDWPGAERGFQRALALNPNLPEAHAHYSWYLLRFGHVEESFRQMRQAIEVDPLTPIYQAWLASLYLHTGNADQAIVEARKSLELRADFPVGLGILAEAYAAKGRFDEAVAAAAQAAAGNPGLRWKLGYVYALGGRRQEAGQVAAELRQKPTAMDAWGLAQIYAALDDKEEAFRWLAAADQQRFSWMGDIWRYMHKSLHDDPRFVSLAQRLKVPPPAPR